MHQRTNLIAVLLLIFANVSIADTTSTLDITTATTTFSPGFKGDLEHVVAGHHGVMGLSLKNLDSGEEIGINGDEMFPTASTIKLAVLCTVFDELSSPTGRFKSYYDTRRYDAATSVSGAGFVQRFKDGTNVEIKELLHFMVTVSDNTATNMLVDAVGGLQQVNNWLMNHGFKVTRMASMVGGRQVWDPKLRDTWGLGVTTPNEMRHLCEMIVKGEAGTTSATDEMLRLLSHQYFDGDIAAEIPPGVWVGSKSGAVNRSRSDNAIVFSPGGKYVLSIYTRENADASWENENEAERNIREISRLVFKHYNPTSAWTRPAGTEKL
jgi:beta-lactamase class A